MGYFSDKCTSFSYECSLIWFSLLIPILTIILSILFYYNRYIYNYDDNLLIEEIEISLNGNLIQSISFKDTCDSQEEKLVLGIWDGTNEGCNCNGIILNGICSKDQKENGCVSLFSNPPIKYTIFNSSYICATKFKLKYKELLKTNQTISKENNCPINYTLCGILDTLGRKLCVKNGEYCPINTNNVQNKIWKLFSKNESVPFENNYYNYNLNTDKDAQLISIIKVIQYKPCINPSEKYWDYHYVLEIQEKKCLTEIKGDVYDSRYQLISNSISKLQLYNENSITPKLQNIDDANLNKIEKDKVYLYSRNFLGIEINELEKSGITYDKLISSQKLIQKHMKCQKIYSFIIFIFFVGNLLIPVIGKLACKACVCEFELIINRIFCFCFGIFLILYYLSPIYYIYIYSKYIYPNTKLIKSFLNIKSADKIALELLHQLNEKCSKNYRYSLSMLIINPFIIVFEIISLKFWFSTFIKIIKNKWYEHKKKDISKKDTLIKPKEKEKEKEEDEDYAIFPLKHDHTLTRKSNKPNETCKICQKLLGKAPAFICDECELAICNLCTNKIIYGKKNEEIHPHLLGLTLRNAWKCDVCNERFRKCASFYCNSCDFDACPKCYIN